MTACRRVYHQKAIALSAAAKRQWCRGQQYREPRKSNRKNARCSRGKGAQDGRADRTRKRNVRNDEPKRDYSNVDDLDTPVRGSNSSGQAPRNSHSRTKPNAASSQVTAKDKEATDPAPANQDARQLARHLG